MAGEFLVTTWFDIRHERFLSASRLDPQVEWFDSWVVGRACFPIAGSRDNIVTCFGLNFEIWKKIDKIIIGDSFHGCQYVNWNWVTRATI